jgi:hypothetical protein
LFAKKFEYLQIRGKYLNIFGEYAENGEYCTPKQSSPNMAKDIYRSYLGEVLTKSKKILYPRSSL